MDALTSWRVSVTREAASEMENIGVFYSSSIFVSQRVGGISRLFVELAEHMERRGHEVRVVAPLHRSQYLSRSPIGRGWELPRVLDARGGGAVARAVAGLMEAAVAARVPRHRSIWHATYVSAPRLLRMPLVATAFDLTYEDYPTLLPRAEQVIEQKRSLYDRADAIVAISENTAHRLSSGHDVDPSKIVVAPLAVDHEIFRPSGQVTADPSSAPKILYVGRRDSYKNFETLIESLRAREQLKECQLVCFGGGGPTPAEIDLLSTARLLERTTFTSGDDQALARTYRDCSVLVVPSLDEGFGLPMLEAMASGCPVLASSGGALPEVSGGAAVHFDPRDPSELGRQLDRILSDGELRERLRSDGLQRAHQFRWSVTCAATERAYRLALS